MQRQQPLVYVIEDEEDLGQMIIQTLQDFGYDARLFSNGTQASRSLLKDRPDISIIDLGLPDMDGLTLVKQLCDTDEMGIIIISGRSSLPDKVLGLELGADDYLSKPFEENQLLKVVTRWLGKNILKENKVVDAGAKGFVHFIEGFLRALKGEEIVLELEKVDNVEQLHVDHLEDSTNRYCTEALIRGSNIDLKKLKEDLALFGDSLVVAGSNRTVRIHIHSNKPADVFAYLDEIGNIVEQKVEYGQSGYIDFKKAKKIQPTLFSKYGNKIFITLTLLYIFLIFSFNRFKK